MTIVPPESIHVGGLPNSTVNATCSDEFQFHAEKRAGFLFASVRSAVCESPAHKKKKKREIAIIQTLIVTIVGELCFYISDDRPRATREDDNRKQRVADSGGRIESG